MCHSKFIYSGFLLFLEQQGAHEYYSLTKNQERTTLPSTTSDRQRARVKRENAWKSNGVTRWRELQSTYYVTSISARKTGTWAFLTPFSTTFRWRIFSQINRNRLVGTPKRPFPSKTQNQTTSPNFSSLRPPHPWPDRVHLVFLQRAQYCQVLDWHSTTWACDICVSCA